MTMITKAQLAEMINNRPPNMEPKSIIDSLLAKNYTLEGFNPPKPKSTEKSFIGKAFDVATAPVRVGTALMEEAIGQTAKGAGALAGAVGLDGVGNSLTNVGQKFSDLTKSEEFRQDLAKSGQAAKVGLPIAAGIATAGASLPITAAVSATAGATGSVAKDVTDFNDQSVVQVAKNAVVSGASDAAIDGITFGLGKAIKGATGGIKSRLISGLNQRAVTNVGKALKPTTNANKEIVDQIAPEILNRPMKETFGMTATGIANKADIARRTVGDRFDDVPVKGFTKITDLVASLNKEKEKFVVDGVVVDKGGVKAIEDVQRIFKQYGDKIDNSTLREVQRIFYSQIQGKGGFNTSIKEGSEVQVKKVAAGKIRDILASSNPDLAKLNKEYSFWSKLQDVAEATAKRQVGQTDGLIENAAGVLAASSELRDPSGAGVGSMIMKGLAFKYAIKALRSPGTRLATAKAQKSLADTIANDIASNNFQAVLRTILKVRPDLQSEIDDEAALLEDDGFTIDNEITNRMVDQGLLPESEREIFTNPASFQR